VTMKWWHHIYRPLSDEERRREAKFLQDEQLRDAKVLTAITCVVVVIILIDIVVSLSWWALKWLYSVP